MSRSNIYTLNFRKQLPLSGLFALWTLLFSCAVFAQDEQELYDYLYPTGQQALPMSSSGKNFNVDGFSSNPHKPWNDEQKIKLENAFKNFSPAKDSSRDEGVKLIDVYKEGSSSASNIAPSPYDSLIVKYAEATGQSPNLIKLMIHQESRFNPLAISKKKAKGLMQLMASVYSPFGIDPLDPESNIKVGTLYFSSLVKRYNGNLKLALAAYNAGPGAVDEYGGIPPYAETQNYVRVIMAGFEKQESLKL